MSQTTDQGSAPTLRFPPIDDINNLVDVKDWLKAMQNELETSHREMLRDDNKVFKTEIPDLNAQIAVAGGDFDVPLLEDTDFADSGSWEITWTKGNITYAGTTKSIVTTNAPTSGAGANEVVYVYFRPSDWGDSSTTITLRTGRASVSAAITLLAGDVIISHRVNGGTTFTSLIWPVIVGGFIQANTLNADSVIVSGTLTASTVIVSGSTTLANWRSSADLTKIDGGNIYTNSVTAAAIDVDNLFAVDITVTNKIHTAGKDTYSDTTAGWWLGLDGGTPKFVIGNATRFVRWTGTEVEVRGDIVADDITTGTLNIGSLTITGEGIDTANMVDAAIETEKVKDDAISQGLNNARTGDLSLTASFQDVCSITITPTTGKLLLIATMVLENTANNPQTITWKIDKDGSTPLITGDHRVGTGLENTWTMHYVVLVSTGISQTWRVKALTTAGAGNHKITVPTHFTILELKK